MIITQNASSAQCFQSDVKNLHPTQYLIAQELAKIEFVSPTGFGYWEAMKNKDVVGLINMDFIDGEHDGKWKFTVFGWGFAYYASYQEAEDAFFREYSMYLRSINNNN